MGTDLEELNLLRLNSLRAIRFRMFIYILTRFGFQVLAFELRISTFNRY